MSRVNGYNRGEAYKVLQRFFHGYQIQPTNSIYGPSSESAKTSATSPALVDAAIRFYSCYKDLADAGAALQYKMAQIENKYLTENSLNSTKTYSSTYTADDLSIARDVAAAAGSGIVYGKRKKITLNGSAFWVLEENFCVVRHNSSYQYTGGYHLANNAPSPTAKKGDAELYVEHYKNLARYMSDIVFGHDLNDVGNISTPNYISDMGGLFGDHFAGTSNSYLNSAHRWLGQLIKNDSTKWSNLEMPDKPAGKVVKPLTYDNCVALIQGTDSTAMQIPISDIKKLLKRFNITTVGSTPVDSITVSNATAIRDALNTAKAWGANIHLLEATMDRDNVTPNIKRAFSATIEPPEGWKYFEVQDSSQDNPVRYYYPARYYRNYQNLPSYIKTAIQNDCGSNLATSNTGYMTWDSTTVTDTTGVTSLNGTVQSGTAMSSQTILKNTQAAINVLNPFYRLTCHYIMKDLNRMYALLGVSNSYVQKHRDGVSQLFPHCSIYHLGTSAASVLYHNNANVSYLRGEKNANEHGSSNGDGSGKRLQLCLGTGINAYTDTSKGTAKPTVYTSNGYAYSSVGTGWIMTHEATHQTRNHNPTIWGWLNEGLSDTIWGSPEGSRVQMPVFNINGFISLWKSAVIQNNWSNPIAFNADGTMQVGIGQETLTSSSSGVLSLAWSIAPKEGSSNYYAKSLTDMYAPVTLSGGATATAVNGKSLTIDKPSTQVVVKYPYISPISDTWWQYVGGAIFVRWLIWSVMQGWDKQWAIVGNHTHFPLNTEWDVTKPYYNPSTGTYG